jgi:hypothetical protein
MEFIVEFAIESIDRYTTAADAAARGPAVSNPATAAVVTPTVRPITSAFLCSNFAHRDAAYAE